MLSVCVTGLNGGHKHHNTLYDASLSNFVWINDNSGFERIFSKPLISLTF